MSVAVQEADARHLVSVTVFDTNWPWSFSPDVSLSLSPSVVAGCRLKRGQSIDRFELSPLKR